MFKILVVITCFLVSVKCAELPSYIKKCKLSDPNLNNCITEHANGVIPTIVKGDANFKIISMSPLVIPIVELGANTNLEMRLNQLNTDDIKDVKVKSTNFDSKSNKISFDASMDVLQILAKYFIKGQILVLPITGEGDTNMTFINNKIKYEAEFGIKKVGDEEFYTVEKTRLEMEPGRVYFRFDNLFSGDQTLGKQMNEFLNTNWKDFFSELKPAVTGTMEAVVTNVFKAYFSKVPINKIFDS